MEFSKKLWVFLQMKFENYGVLEKIMGFFPNEKKLWGFYQMKNLKIALQPLGQKLET